MNIPKKVIGWWFFLIGALGGFLLGYMQITGNKLVWYYSLIYISFLGSWYVLFDYARRLENETNKP